MAISVGVTRRALLAGDLAGITGVVSIGGTPVVGASIELFRDDGDSIFEPGAGDTQVGAAAVTGATGSYLFDRLIAGDYWVRQPAQTVGTIDLGLAVSSLRIRVEPHAALGIHRGRVRVHRVVLPDELLAPYR